MNDPVASTAEIRADFDRIAHLGDDGADHNRHHHPFLLRQLPDRCGEALEVGCGLGSFARLLARRAEHVLALDLSPEMIRAARERSEGVSNVEYRVVDVTDWDFPADRFDVVASIATLHHLPLAPTLARMASSLKPGGTLAVLDLYERRGAIDGWLDLIAIPRSCLLRLVRTGRLRPERRSRRAWAEHAARDTYATIAEIRRVAREVLPGSVVRRHLLWRYSLIWQKPTAIGDDGHGPCGRALRVGSREEALGWRSLN